MGLSATAVDNSTLRLREALQLHELGYLEASVMTARVAIEQGLLERIGNVNTYGTRSAIRKLTFELQRVGKISNTRRKRVHDIYGSLSEVAHGGPVTEKDAYEMIVQAGEARDMVAAAIEE